MNNNIESAVSMSNVRPLFGIIGGMGPLSSAQFINSLYGYCLDKFVVEQDYPRIIMISDPIIPDRAKAMKNNKAHLVISSFEEKIEGLASLGVDEIIIACVTAHLYLDKLNDKSKKRLTDIVKLLYSELDKQSEKSLILSSMAVYDNQVISHPKAIYPSRDDVQFVQDFIFKIKLNCSNEVLNSFIQLVNGLSLKYQTKSIVFACTELHLAKLVRPIFLTIVFFTILVMFCKSYVGLENITKLVDLFGLLPIVVLSISMLISTALLYFWNARRREASQS